MSVVEAITSLIATFEKYAGSDGDKHKLSKPELKRLVEIEMKDLINTSNPELLQSELDTLMSALDENGDQLVDFKEYMTVIASITMNCHGF